VAGSPDDADGDVPTVPMPVQNGDAAVLNQRAGGASQLSVTSSSA
jgi:hypothetical protein